MWQFSLEAFFDLMFSVVTKEKKANIPPPHTHPKTKASVSHNFKNKKGYKTYPSFVVVCFFLAWKMSEMAYLILIKKIACSAPGLSRKWRTLGMFRPTYDCCIRNKGYQETMLRENYQLGAVVMQYSPNV